MNFKDIPLFDLSNKLTNLDKLYAHTSDNSEQDNEPLAKHLTLVYRYFLKICELKNLDKIFFHIYQKKFPNAGEAVYRLWLELLINAIYLHDIGKININYQFQVMRNEYYKTPSQINSKHSMLSACIYFDYYFRRIIDKIDKLGEENVNTLLIFLTVNSYIISKHHGCLGEFKDFKDNFLGEYAAYSYGAKKEIYPDYQDSLETEKDQIENIIIYTESRLDDFEDKEAWLSIDLYVYTKLVFSSLTGADFYATAEYQSGKKIEDFGLIEDVQQYFNIFKENSIYQNIARHRDFLHKKGQPVFQDKDINLLRSELFLEAENSLQANLDKKIFYLEAPAGSGKTITSLNLAFKLLEQQKNLNKVFYIFPFNTLVEQTYTSFQKIFENHENLRNDVAIINSITPIRTEDITEENNEVNNIYLDSKQDRKIDYQKSLLNRQFLHYPFVITTHVNLFNYLFGLSREESFPLTHLANSVIILDEIQSYRNSIWKELIIFLEKYAESLNMKIIIMSATLPRLEYLGVMEDRCTYLITKREKYYDNDLFKKRVKLDFSLFAYQEKIQETLLAKVKEIAQNKRGKILIEFIKKRSALDFFKALKQENLDMEILLMTGDDNKIDRKNIIEKVKSQSDVILVATQVIEAGVDIDMDIGFKDISILDSEEQFLGRINRACTKLDSIVYFFDLDAATLIYKKDFRKDKKLTLRVEEIRQILIDKNFPEYYQIVMEKLAEYLQRKSDSNIDDFRNETIASLDFPKIKKRLELIDEDLKEYTIFINREINLANGETIRGSEVWQSYKELLMDKKMDYAEKRIKLSQVLEKLDYFTYKVNFYGFSYNDLIGDIYYLEDGNDYFIDGKFDRSGFNRAVDYDYFGC